MSLTSWENKLLDKYLEAQECRGECSRCERGDCCGDECADRYDDDYDDSMEEWKAELRAERDEADW